MQNVTTVMIPLAAAAEIIHACSAVVHCFDKESTTCSTISSFGNAWTTCGSMASSFLTITDAAPVSVTIANKTNWEVSALWTAASPSVVASFRQHRRA